MLDLHSEIQRARESGRLIIFVVYLSLFLDNMLLSAVVPILPDYIYAIEHNLSIGLESDVQDVPEASFYRLANKTETGNDSMLVDDIINENARIGLLFASKALVQLVVNPFVGCAINRIGYHLPMLVGCGNLFVSCILFGVSKSYGLLFFARSLQGVGSACFSISGMSMLAAIYQEDEERSHAMGLALGGIASGVLVGYPFGGLMYDFVGKELPFFIISGLTIFDAVLQSFVLRPLTSPEKVFIGTPSYQLLKDPYIVIIAGAVCVTTTAMAILEPCLPIWLIDTVHPKKWQLGTVFVPDSLGYLLGTNLGVLAYRIGRWLTAILSVMMVGICAIVLPFSSSMIHLIFPHFGMGLGIGMTDAALMPLLARLVDTRHVTSYGSVYAIAQVAVSLAYSIGPLIGSEAVKSVGFAWVMRTVGIINLLFCPLCFFLRNPPIKEETQAMVLHRPPLSSYSATCRRSSKENSSSFQPYRQFSGSESD